MGSSWKRDIWIRQIFERISYIDGDVSVTLSEYTPGVSDMEDVLKSSVANFEVENSQRIIEELHALSEDGFSSAVQKMFPVFFKSICSQERDFILILSTNLAYEFRYVIPLIVRVKTGVANFDLKKGEVEDVIIGQFNYSYEKCSA